MLLPTRQDLLDRFKTFNMMGTSAASMVGQSIKILHSDSCCDASELGAVKCQDCTTHMTYPCESCAAKLSVCSAG